jgi:hypothetical protein
VLRVVLRMLGAGCRLDVMCGRGRGERGRGGERVGVLEGLVERGVEDCGGRGEVVFWYSL